MEAIYTFSNSAEAAIASGMLRSNGIECVTQQATLDTIYPTPGGAFGGVTLYVPASQVKEALALLRDHDDI